MAFSEGVDAGRYTRGLLMELKSKTFHPSDMEATDALEGTPMMLVTDARDVFDHVNKDTLGLPQNRSLALEVTLLREEMGYAGTTLRWTV